MRPIDADAMNDKYSDWYTEEGPEEGYIGTVKGIVDSMPTINPRTKAKWIKPTGMMPPEHAGHYECSNCGFWAMRDWLRLRVVLTNFCPNCGADMREEME